MRINFIVHCHSSFQGDNELTVWLVLCTLKVGCIECIHTASINCYRFPLLFDVWTICFSYWAVLFWDMQYVLEFIRIWKAYYNCIGYFYRTCSYQYHLIRLILLYRKTSIVSYSKHVLWRSEWCTQWNVAYNLVPEGWCCIYARFIDWVLHFLH